MILLRFFNKHCRCRCNNILCTGSFPNVANYQSNTRRRTHLLPRYAWFFRLRGIIDSVLDHRSLTLEFESLKRVSFFTTLHYLLSRSVHLAFHVHKNINDHHRHTYCLSAESLVVMLPRRLTLYLSVFEEQHTPSYTTEKYWCHYGQIPKDWRINRILWSTIPNYSSPVQVHIWMKFSTCTLVESLGEKAHVIAHSGHNSTDVLILLLHHQ